MYSDSNIKRSWVEVNLRKLIENLDAYKAELNNKTQIMAVVKADAYGHGAQVISNTLANLRGLNLFAVSNIEEAIELRMSGITGEILILGYTPIVLLNEVEKYNLTQTLLSEEYAEMVYGSGINVKCQFAIDTGMNRIGLDSSNIDKCIKIIKKYSDLLYLNGVFTHLCVADEPKIQSCEFTRLQIQRFNTVVDKISDLNLKYIHYMNSAGGLFHSGGGIVRLGIVLYGLKPDYKNVLPKKIQPVLAWKTVIAMIKTVEEGNTVGYGRIYQTTKRTRIATLPTGYADGYRRELSNVGYVLIKGKRANIVGRICMDQMMVDVTDIEGVSVGDEVILIGEDSGEHITADDMARMIGTIGYEIVCGISKRVPRKYSD